MPAQARISKQKYNSATLALPAAGTAATGWFPVRGRRLSIPAEWSGTPTGTFSLQYEKNDGTAAAVPGASVEFTANGNAQPAASASSALWNWSNVPAGKVRILYTATSSTGTLTYSPIWSD